MRLSRCFSLSAAGPRLLVGPSGLEPPTSCLSGTRSNHLSYEPSFRVRTRWHTFGLVSPCRFFSYDNIHTVLKIVGNLFPFWLRIRMRWWRWWDSNPWPPACRAGALPAELHPHISCFANDVAFGKRCELRSMMLPSANVLCNFGICFSPFLKILKNWTKKCQRLRSSSWHISKL